MHNRKDMVALLGILVLAIPTSLAAVPAPPADKDAIVIVFKDGRQQAFSMADIERIEFKAPASNTAVIHGSSFLGKWKVGDGSFGTFSITLDRDGVATKTLGASHGSWTVVDNDARISWDDGWH